MEAFQGAMVMVCFFRMKDLLVPIDQTGRIALPEDVRQELAIKPGDTFKVAIEGVVVTLTPEAKGPPSMPNGMAPKSIQEVIDSSRWILQLEEDWDENGSGQYAQATYERACNFLAELAEVSARRFGQDLPTPKILPGPDGTIDIHWKMPQFELLVNVSHDSARPVSFYGDDYGLSFIKGHVTTPEATRHLVVWLAS
jgi:bifunctional DNA-binding transcriptional regulator/antitoxin component of YhaV-PrlF toxin-antitoxin module